MSIVFKRYDLALDDTMHEDAEGEFVKAQDALDRCAVLSAEIATLKAQLKGYQEREKIARYALAYGATQTSLEEILRST
jgi:uncharacterized small protein (DUF1192 family)